MLPLLPTVLVAEQRLAVAALHGVEWKLASLEAEVDWWGSVTRG